MVTVETPPMMDLEAFLAWDAPSNARWQLVDGDPRAMAPASVPHSTLVCAEVLRRAADGSWPDRMMVVTEGVLELDSIGFSVELAALYARTRLAGGGVRRHEMAIRRSIETEIARF